MKQASLLVQHEMRLDNLMDARSINAISHNGCMDHHGQGCYELEHWSLGGGGGTHNFYPCCVISWEPPVGHWEYSKLI